MTVTEQGIRVELVSRDDGSLHDIWTVEQAAKRLHQLGQGSIKDITEELRSMVPLRTNALVYQPVHTTKN